MYSTAAFVNITLHYTVITLRYIHNNHGECYLVYLSAWACERLVADETQQLDGRSGV